MTLDVLDELTLARLGQIGVWVSLYWDEPYNTLQSSLLEVRPTRENLELLREGRWLRRSDSNVPMRICHRSNENEGANLVCTLYPATWILSKRVSTEVVKNENAEAAMRRLVAAMDPWPRLELGELVGFDTRYTAQTSGGSVLNYLTTIGAACDLGFRIALSGKNADKKLRFEVYRPTADPNNRFSTKWGSLTGASWAFGDNYVDARDVQPDEEKGETNTSPDYLQRLMDRGTNKLLEQLRTGSIEVSLDADLAPGDVAFCTLPELGYKATVRVADVITQSQSDSTTRTVRLGTPVWRKL